MDWVIGMPFLYFPEDKSEYIPAVITMAFFMVACVLTFLAIKRYSKKEEEKTKELVLRMEREKKLRQNRNE